MSDPKPPYPILCVRFIVANARFCVPQSARGQKCSECGLEVVMAPSSMALVEAGTVTPVCRECFDEWSPEKQARHVPTLAPGAVQEIRDWARQDTERN